MIKAKVTKNIMAKSAANIGGMPITIKQAVCGVLCIAIAVGEFFWLDKLINGLSMNVKMSLIFVTVSAIVMFTVVNIQGVPMFKFIWLGLKGPDKRPYCSKGIFDEDEET